MNISSLHSIFLKHPYVCTDSRKKVNDGIFFALKGASFDGNFYADIALENGCKYAIIDNPSMKRSDQYILVNDVLLTLQNLATFHRKFLNIPIIGITGTNGKTTTKELINEVLSTKFKTLCTQGNLNNQIGVPLTLLSMTSETQIGIVEMGANHLGEIKELCEIALPDFGIITNIGKAHLQGFGDYEGVKKTKKELYDFIKKNNGTLFVNYNDPVLIDLSNNINSIYYGESTGIECSGKIIANSLYVSIECAINTSKFELHSNLFGNYNANNIMAAACIGNYFNVPVFLIKQGIENYVPTNNRSQLTKTSKNILFMDAYNANPSSMTASISNFNSLSLENKILILGEMFELGDEHETEHSKIIELVSNMDFRHIYLIGKWGVTEKKNMTRFESTQNFIEWIKVNDINNSNILIKGSRGIKLEQIIDFL